MVCTLSIRKLITEAHLNTAKDDLALIFESTHNRNPSSTSNETNTSNVGLESNQKHRKRDRIRSNKSNLNRYSCGDFSRTPNWANPIMGPSNSIVSAQGNMTISYLHAFHRLSILIKLFPQYNCVI